MGAQSTSLLERVRWQLTELLTIGFGKPPQVHEAELDGKLSEITHETAGVFETGVDAFQLLLAHILLGCDPQMPLEQSIKRARTQPGMIGQDLGTQLTFDVLIDVLKDSFETDRGRTTGVANYVTTQKGEHLVAYDLRVVLMNAR